MAAALPVAVAIERLIVGQRDIAVRRMIAVQLAVDAHGIVGFALRAPVRLPG